MLPGFEELPRYLPKGKYAQHRGFSPAYLSKLLRLGKITAVTSDGKIDRVRADAQLQAQRDPSYAPPAPKAEPGPAAEPDEADDTFAELRREGQRLANRQRQIDVDRTEGLLVERAEVEREAFNAGRQLRDRMMAVPGQIAGELAAMTDEREIAALLRKEIRKALTEAASDVRTSPDGLPE